MKRSEPLSPAQIKVLLSLRDKEPSAVIAEGSPILDWTMALWDDPTILERSLISNGNEEYHRPPDYWALSWVHGSREQLETRSR